MMFTVIASLLFAGAMAACPNACSHHGECGEFDSCDCHAGFQGGDCSERVCLYNWAWVTTANGDLNFDGDRYDGTVYSITTPIEASIANNPTVGFGGQVLLTQQAPGGTWESWPYYGSAEEGHYYMECSNRGLCDRTSGDCVCFDGYTGTACNRMVCPEDCSDHGVCQTVKDFDSSYALWDRNMARSCKCDAGYTGPACETRKCPHGNDPLTKTNELWEIQHVDIYSKCAGTNDATGDGVNGQKACGAFSATSVQLGGYVRLTYTDSFGEAYTTAPVLVQTMDNSSSAHAVAANVQAALRNLPNDVVSNQLTVTAQYCETNVDDMTDPGTGADGYTANAFRVLDATKGANSGADSTAVYLGAIDVDGDGNTDEGKVAVAGASGQTVFDAGALVGGSTVLAALSNPMCIRLKVVFNGMPGALQALTADYSGVTYQGETNSQNNGAKVEAFVHKGYMAISHNTLSIGYTTPSTVKKEGSDVQIDIAAKTITFSTATLGNDVTDIFYPNSRIKVECQYQLQGVNTYRNLGAYTVSAASLPDTGVITVKETIAANTCTTAQSTVKVTSISNIITTDEHDITQSSKEYGPSMLQAGERVLFGTTNFFGTTVKSLEYHSGMTYGAKGYIILNEEWTDSLSASITAVDAGLEHHTSGTRENVECSDRGLCQEDGVCKCFQGYTGDDCSKQLSIAL